MNTQYLTVGDLISLRGRTGELDYYSNNIAVIKFKDGTSESVSHIELEKARSDGEMCIVRRPSYNPCHIKTSHDQDAEILRYERYCSELEKEARPCAKGVRERVIIKVAAELNDKRPPSISNLHKIYRKWKSAGKNMIQALFGKQRNRSPAISEEVFELMDEVIESRYLKIEKPTILRAYNEFVRVYRTRSYIAPCPSLSSFERRVKKFNRIAVIESRYGRSAAREEQRTVTSKTKTKQILEVVELDTAHFNLGLRNKFGRYVGMPSIYFSMDSYSRAIMGYGIHIGKHSESSGCVIHTLRYAISKKNDPLYPFFGIPATLVLDQGAAYISEDSIRYFESLMATVTNTATRMGWGKPMVERFIGTARTRFFSGFDGYLGKKNKKIYSDDTVKKSAVHTVAEFRQAFSDFIIEYHNTPHSGLNGRTPAQVWMESAKTNPPIGVEDLPHSQLLRGLREEKIIKHVTGITCDYQNFNSNELQALYHELQSSQKPGVRNEAKVTIYRDPLDASAVSIVNPRTNRLFEVPNILGGEAQGFSFAELRLSRKALTTAEASPCWNGGVSEGYIVKKPRKGPDVHLDDFDNPVDLNMILNAPGKQIPTNTMGYENRSQTDEDEDYEIIVE